MLLTGSPSCRPRPLAQAGDRASQVMLIAHLFISIALTVPFGNRLSRQSLNSDVCRRSGCPLRTCARTVRDTKLRFAQYELKHVDEHAGFRGHQFATRKHGPRRGRRKRPIRKDPLQRTAVHIGQCEIIGHGHDSRAGTSESNQKLGRIRTGAAPGDTRPTLLSP